MSTYLDVKTEVATQLGKKDYDTPDMIRDTAIKRARRKFYKEYPWSFNNKVDDITFVLGEAPFPTDIEETFIPKVYGYDGTLKTPYKLVDIADVDGYVASYPVFALDYNNKKILSNLSSTVKIDYQIKPNESPTDIFVELTDDISAITALAIAYYWLAKERNDDMFKLFSQSYEAERARLIIRDRLSEPVRRFKPDTTDYGYGA